MFNFIERRFLYPAPRTNDCDWNPSDLAFEDAHFTAADGPPLHGWYVPHPQPRAILLYSHGNGECVPHLANRLRVLNQQIGATVFAWDYRGYGRSQGKPHETNLIADARLAQLWLANRVEIEPENIVLVGRSLGGAVSIAVAAEYPVQGLVLDRTFSCLVDTASHHFP
jgi:alpha-beta hydrolase superfamily lysophospholipase